MYDLISKQGILSHINDLMLSYAPCDGHGDQAEYDFWKRVFDYIESIPAPPVDYEAEIEVRDKEIEWLKLCVNTLPRPQNWISVKDRFPEDYEDVLTCSDHGNIHIFNYSHTQKYPFNINPRLSNYYPVAYWMPLPEPPKDLPFPDDQAEKEETCTKM